MRPASPAAAQRQSSDADPGEPYAAAPARAVPAGAPRHRRAGAEVSAARDGHARAVSRAVPRHRRPGRRFTARGRLRPGSQPPWPVVRVLRGRRFRPGGKPAQPRVRAGGRRFRSAGAALAGAALLAAALLATLLPAAASASGPSYVALGDSYTSGPLIPDQTGSPIGCLRSNHDYPSLVAAAIGASSFKNVSCARARTTNMTSAQDADIGTNPPQLNALSKATTLVTLQIGGDDLGFSSIVVTCGALSFTDPFGAPCQKHYTSGGTDRLAEAVAQTGPKVAAILVEIHRRAPAARVLLLGYPALLPNTGRGCWPLMPIAFGDVPYLRGIELKMNQMLAGEAAAHGATYVDVYTDSIGHNLCTGPGTQWVAGIVPTSLAAPVHPNAAGERAMARQVLAALR